MDCKDFENSADGVAHARSWCARLGCGRTNLRVLLIDDDAAFTAMMAEYLAVEVLTREVLRHHGREGHIVVDEQNAQIGVRPQPSRRTMSAREPVRQPNFRFPYSPFSHA